MLRRRAASAAPTSREDVGPGGATASWHVPLVTTVLLALNLLIFLYQSSLPVSEQELLFLRWAAIPLEITEQDIPPATPVTPIVTLFTTLLLHATWLHLGTNLFYLWVFGEGVERALSRGQYLSVYILSGVAGALLQVAINPTSLIPVVGASGAIAGIMAVYVVLFPKITPQLLIFGFWLVLQVVGGSQALTLRKQWGAGLALWAHIGGFMVGAALAFSFRLRRARPTVRPSPVED